jgi:hypothetical protein
MVFKCTKRNNIGRSLLWRKKCLQNKIKATQENPADDYTNQENLKDLKHQPIPQIP